MSRVAKQPVPLPQGVTATLTPELVTLKGAKGTASLVIKHGVLVVQEGNALQVSKSSDSRKPKYARRGPRARISPISSRGVTKGYEKLELVGVGLSREASEQESGYDVGLFPIRSLCGVPEGIAVETPTQTEILVKGMDRQRVGGAAADIQEFGRLRPVRAKACAIQATDREEAKERRNDRQEGAQRLRRYACKIREFLKVVRLFGASHFATYLRADFRPRNRKCWWRPRPYRKRCVEGLKGTGNVSAAALSGKAIAEGKKAYRASRGWRSIARVSSTTAASRRWRMRRVKTGSSSVSVRRKGKTYGQELKMSASGDDFIEKLVAVNRVAPRSLKGGRQFGFTARFTVVGDGNRPRRLPGYGKSAKYN